ncbi:hypothetical protein HDU85_000941 [Gaertneriomyces sp. JEL0708]|nr:hypothetical protein HDU85_000941 [Gaertneriomyces sp. JEL0708]
MTAVASTGQRKVWAVPEKGALSNLTLKSERAPAPEPHHVRVQVRAIGLNFADVFSVLGLYAAANELKGDFIPGLEFSGIVETDGDVFKKGQRVFGTTRFGAYATHINADENYLRPLPEEWSFEEGAAFPVQTLTAWYALSTLGNLKEGMTVLVQSAAGGVGLQSLRILENKKGINVLGLVGRPEKVSFLEEMFPTKKDWQFVTRSDSSSAFATQLQDYLASVNVKGFDIILDAVSGPYFHPSYEALIPTGRHVIFGAASLTPTDIDLTARLAFLNPLNILRALKLAYKFLTRPKLDPMKLVGDNKAVMGFNLIWVYDKLDMMAEMYATLDAMGLRAPHVGHKFEFGELPAAMELFQTGRTVGKVVIQVPQSE